MADYCLMRVQHLRRTQDYGLEQGSSLSLRIYDRRLAADGSTDGRQLDGGRKIA